MKIQIVFLKNLLALAFLFAPFFSGKMMAQIETPSHKEHVHEDKRAILEPPASMRTQGVSGPVGAGSPNVVVSFEPVDGDNILYHPVAAYNSTLKGKAQVSVIIWVKNNEATPLYWNKIILKYTQAGVVKTRTVTMLDTIPAGKTGYEQNGREYHAEGDVVYIDEPIPANITIELYFKTFPNPVSITKPLKPYTKAFSLPFRAYDLAVGVIDSEHSQKNFFTPWHLQLLTAIASLCSNKIALAESETARQQALLFAVDNQRKAAEAKLQSMRLQMNPHFLFNALNSIQQMILSGNSDGAAMYLSKFSKLLRMVLTHSDRDFIHLREELDILHLYLELEALRFDDTFTYSIDCQPGLDKEEYRVPPLLIQPFVENAIWHGLLQKEGKRSLHITFESTDDDRLRCTIEDNGIGREAAGAFSRNGHLHTGRGLSTSEERIETLNRQYGQHNTLEIKDLFSEDGTAAGTEVRILFE